MTCIVANCKNLGSHYLPKDETKKQQWIKALRLDTHKKIGRVLRPYSSILCSNHFKPSDFIYSSPHGISRKRLKRDAVPSIFHGFPVSKDPESTNLEEPDCTNLEEPSTSEIQTEYKNISNLKTYSKPVLPMTFVEEQPFLNEETEENAQDPLDLLPSCDFSDRELEQHSNTECSPHKSQTSENSQVSELAIEIEIDSNCSTQQLELLPKKSIHSEYQQCDKSVQTDVMNEGVSIHKIKNNEKAIHFYTGLEAYHKFMLIFHSLGPSAFQLNYYYNVQPPKHIDVLDQLFMTMIILYRHKTFEEMSMLFLTTIKQVYNIFITWIRFMSLQWKQIDLWVSKEIVQSFMPTDFFDKYPSTRVVLDATECPIKKPKLPLAQQITFSTYKNKNTIKFMIGITPSGLISYVSPSYGGSTSDRQIIERSDILNRFNYGDEIMVDKGINVQDILISHGVKVNMPAFFKKGNQIQSATLTANRKVASKRVHIERVIGQLKTYKILTQPMNKTETILSSDIVFVCAMLVNFRSNIVNKNA